MTREEAIEILQGAIKKPNTKDGYLGQAIDMAIKALEQEPCEDAIYRQAVLKEIPVLWNSNGDKNYCMESLRDFVTELPSVTPTRKAGNWIKIAETDEIVCEACNCSVVFKSSFCPNCGADMRESEGKE